MPSYCSWCNNEILAQPDDPDAAETDLCLDCLLTLISGDRPERRQGERRRYSSHRDVERRNQPDRRRDSR